MLTRKLELSVDPADLPDTQALRASGNQTIVLNTDFKVDVNQYISELLFVPTGVKNLADLIQFNIDHADEELVQPFWTDQSECVRCSLPLNI